MKKPPTKITLPSKALIQIWSRSKPSQISKSWENSATLTSLTTNTKGTSLGRKEQEKKERKKSSKNKSKVINKMAVRTYISIITLNVNGLNVPTKRHWLAEWVQKQYPYIRCLQETHFTSRNTYILKLRDWKKIFHTKGT